LLWTPKRLFRAERGLERLADLVNIVAPLEPVLAAAAARVRRYTRSAQ